MKSTALIHDICKKYGGKKDKRPLMILLLQLRLEIKAEVKAKIAKTMKDINSMYC